MSPRAFVYTHELLAPLSPLWVWSVSSGYRAGDGRQLTGERFSADVEHQPDAVSPGPSTLSAGTELMRRSDQSMRGNWALLRGKMCIPALQCLSRIYLIHRTNAEITSALIDVAFEDQNERFVLFLLFKINTNTWFSCLSPCSRAQSLHRAACRAGTMQILRILFQLGCSLTFCFRKLQQLINRPSI